MTTYTYDEATLSDAGHFGLVEQEINAVVAPLGITCLGLSFQARLSAGSRLNAEFSGTLTEAQQAQVAAAIAAYPTILIGLTGTFPVVDGGEYLLHETILFGDESIVLDCHVHCALGVSGDFASSYLDWYIKADRQGEGAIIFSEGSAVALNDIRGSKIEAQAVGGNLRVILRVRRDGLLTMFKNDIDEESRGKVPAA